MSKNLSPAVSYFDAYIAEKNTVVFFSKLDSYAHDDHTNSRTHTYIKGSWGARNIPFMVNSAQEYYPKNKNPPYIIYSLGLMSGAVEAYWPKGAKIEYEFLPGATLDRGLLHLQQIKEIAGHLYVVGPNSQIFRRRDSAAGVADISFPVSDGKILQGKTGQWEVFNQGVEHPSLGEFQAKGLGLGDAMAAFVRYCSLHSIDGCSSEDLYAVGDDGVILHRGKGKWKFLPKVTNSELRRVKQVDSKTVYAVGDKGILLRGNAVDGFQQIPTNSSDNLWGLEAFNGKIYIGASSRGVLVYDGKAVNRVPGLPDFDCHTLHAKDGQLLAVGSKHAYLTDDAKTWKFLQNPDNE